MYYLVERSVNIFDVISILISGFLETYLGCLSGAHSREEGRWSKHDEARETAAIKAAMKFLNKGIEHSNLLYDWLLGNPKIRTDSEPVLTRSHTPVIEEPTSSPDRACLSSSWHSSKWSWKFVKYINIPIYPWSMHESFNLRMVNCIWRRVVFVVISSL